MTSASMPARINLEGAMSLDTLASPASIDDQCNAILTAVIDLGDMHDSNGAAR